MSTVLSVKNIECGYDAFRLKDITFNVCKGEILGIIGPNGSGKTTLLRAISNELPLGKGSITLFDRDVTVLGHKERARQVAVVSQNQLIPAMTVEELVLLGRYPYNNSFQFYESKKDIEIAEHAMKITDTLKFKDRYLDQMSGGEKQLVYIARALAQEPRLLILDEPTTFLDITHQVTLLDLVRRLNREMGITVIMVLHDLNLAGEYCQRLVLMNEGAVHITGNPDEVLDYQTIEEVYKTVVVVNKNPITNKPYVLIVPEEAR
ncbi:MAG: ABC transporter ATP-binding protein [Candidatus Ancaeobacter aquaticus]|nr:ABC transporter ATP-binding protein [Candidatus Ancaeobacter aquaticus]